ncbi:MAG: hypothetical protein M1482_13165 [Chloroflexi bacterium]|nr:hypothetical protein [Chloroflexota bacterium]
MTSKQKQFLFILAAANAALFCCAAPLIYLFLALTLQPELAPAVLNDLVAPPGGLAPEAGPPLKTGWALYPVPADRFAIALPPGWKQISFNSQVVAAQVEEIGRKNPDLSPLGRQENSVASLVKFIAIDPAPKAAVDSFTTNVNVFHRTMPLPAPLSIYSAISFKALQDNPYASKPIALKHITTTAGDAVVFWYDNRLRMPDDQDVATANRQYVLALGWDLYVINCAAPLPLEPEYAPVFDEIAASFRWGRR